MGRLVTRTAIRSEYNYYSASFNVRLCLCLYASLVLPSINLTKKQTASGNLFTTHVFVDELLMVLRLGVILCNLIPQSLTSRSMNPCSVCDQPT